MTQTCYFNEDGNLFLVKGTGNPQFLRHVSLNELSWLDRDEATAIFSGMLPVALAPLDKLREDFTIEVVHGSCSRDEYSADAVILRLIECKVIKKWIPQFTALSPNQVGRLDVWLKAICKIDFLIEEG